MDHYDMDGLPIDAGDWLVKFGFGGSGRVAFDELENFEGENAIISTVFIGMGTTMFETAVWSDTETINVVQKYHTFDDAWAGHQLYLNAFYKYYPITACQERHKRILGTEKTKDFTIDT